MLQVAKRVFLRVKDEGFRPFSARAGQGRMQQGWVPHPAVSIWGLAVTLRGRKAAQKRALGLSTELTGVSTGNGKGHLQAELGEAERLAVRVCVRVTGAPGR